eukprot:GHVS01092579.1.p1 GENE.GHVS01092579.1~~GHVS01092579.1.p1  ORF type:complete len:255 (-),score=40.81 GHVS01092579.1:16-780(-)
MFAVRTLAVGGGGMWSSSIGGSSVGRGLSCLWKDDGFEPGGGIGSMFFQVRWKKRKKKEKIPKNVQQKETATIDPPVRLEDYIGSPEPAFSIAKNIRKSVSRLSEGWRRKVDFRRYNSYRIRRSIGLTHDDAAPSGSAFVTPLTRLQHKSTLPVSLADNSRFSFPHSLHYECFWGPPQTSVEPNHSRCKVSIKLDDLKLTHRQKRFMLEVLGPSRCDVHNGVVVVEADHFTNRNHNAAYLGDALESLLLEVRKM